MKRICFHQDTFKDIEEVSISPLDLGFTRSFAFFEYLRVYEKVPFHIDGHIKRLLLAAKAFHVAFPYSLQKIKSLTEELIELCEERNFGIKYFLTPGISDQGLLPEEKSPTFLIYSTPIPKHPQSSYDEGIAVKSIPALRTFPKYKTSNYLAGSHYLSLYKQKGFNDVIYKNHEGHYLEGVTANFFLFKGKTLITPLEDVLHGITREIVLELAQLHYDIELRAITTKDIKQATGAFFTSTNMEVLPIKQIDNNTIGTGLVCKETKNIMALYQEHIQKTIGDYFLSSCL